MSAFRAGDRISYDDGRPGHQGVQARVLEAGRTGMLVQFDDRYAPTRISFNDKAWMSFIAAAPAAEGK